MLVRYSVVTTTSALPYKHPQIDCGDLLQLFQYHIPQVLIVLQDPPNEQHVDG